MRFIAALAVATALAWALRFELVAGREIVGESPRGLTMKLDRWTGKTYVYFVRYEPINGNPAIVDGWREVGLPYGNNGPLAAWEQAPRVLPDAPFIPAGK